MEGGAKTLFSSRNGKRDPHAYSRQKGDGKLPYHIIMRKWTQNIEVIKKTVKSRTVLRFLL